MRVAVHSKTYGPKAVLADIAIELAEGEVIAISGPSGCGKTTLLRIISGIDGDFEGEVEVPRPIGFVFQEPRLLPWRTVEANVALALPEEIEPGERSRRARHVLSTVGLASEAGRYPRALSLGMARRVAIARALVIMPALMLLDEPFVSLDDATARQLRDLIAALWRDNNITVILVTHNLHEAMDLADRVILIDGAPARIISEVRLEAPREARPPEWKEEQLQRLRAVAGS